MPNARHMTSQVIPGRAFAAYLICSALVGFMLLYRYFVTGTLHYSWLMLPNLILAWIPLGFAATLQWMHSVSRPRPGVSAILVVMWLLFFPNAPYMMTDLVHLTWVSDSISIHFDTALVFLAAFTGVGLGFTSLEILHNLVRKRCSPLVGWLFVSIVWVLTSAGIYLGRVQRWNSWDVLRSPLSVLADARAALGGGEPLLIMTVYTVVPMALYVAFRSARAPE